MTGPYRQDTESTTFLKERIHRLEQEKEDIIQRQEGKSSRREKLTSFWLWFKGLFFDNYGLCFWAIAFAIILVGGGIIYGAYRIDQYNNGETRKYLRGVTPAPISCINVDNNAVCITHDQRLVLCDYEGCSKPSMVKPEDF